jgi:hypothetical protein
MKESVSLSAEGALPPGVAVKGPIMRNLELRQVHRVIHPEPGERMLSGLNEPFGFLHCGAFGFTHTVLAQFMSMPSIRRLNLGRWGQPLAH